MEINGKSEKIILPRPPGLKDGAMCRCGRGYIPVWGDEPIQAHCCFCQDERDIKRNEQRQRENESTWTPEPVKEKPVVSTTESRWVQVDKE